MESRDLGRIFSCSRIYILYILFGVSLFASFPLFAQQEEIISFSDRFIRCYTKEYQERLSTAYPPPSSVEKQHATLHSIKRSLSLRQAELGTIPVIVHVIHNGEVLGEGMNIPYEQIVSQIEVLNEDFRRKPDTRGFNDSPVGADAQIEFCLATVDPQGNLLEEPGVNRVNRIGAGFSPPPFSDEYLMATIQPSTIWDPNFYLNIWVSSLSSVDGRGILGLAQLPYLPNMDGLNLTRSESTDGVSIHYRVFGRVGDLLEPYTFGRTTTHEVGHFLGLIHIWGDGNCSVDDFCDDTPGSDSEVFGCPIFDESCGNRNMLENFMQYTDDVCMNTFTQCQVERMRTVLAQAQRRVSLFSSDRCQLPQSQPVAALSMSGQSTCTGTEIQFLDQSTNLPTRWFWEFEGGVPATSDQQNPVVVYERPGNYTVSLTVSNSSGSDQVVQTGLVTVSESGKDTFFIQNFESVIGDWEVQNPDAEITWELVEAGGGQSGTKAVRVQTYNYGVLGAKDRLISPPIDLRGRNNIQLAFRHAYRNFSSADRDSLNIYVSTDGGNSFPFKVLGIAENGSQNFATNAPVNKDFVPTSSEDWCGGGNGFAACLSINLDQFSGASNVRLAFEVVNDFGNNIYLDDVVLTSDCPQSQITSRIGSLESQGWVLFPNPVSDKVRISPNKQVNGPVQFRIYNSVGQELLHTLGVSYRSGYELNLADLPEGSYIMHIQTPGNILYHKVLIHR